MTQRARAPGNDPSGFTRDLQPAVAPPKHSPSRSPSPTGTDLMALQRTAGNAAVVSMLDAPAPTVSRRVAPHTIHRFYVESDAGEAGASEGFDVYDESFHYRWIPGRRDEAVYEDSPIETGWMARNLYRLKPGAAKPEAGPALGAKAKEAEADSLPSIGVTGKLTASDKGKGALEAAASGSRSSEDEAEPATPPGKTEKAAKKGGPKIEQARPAIEVGDVAVATAKYKDDAVKLLGRTYKGSGSGSIAVGGSGLVGEGSLSAERVEGASKSTVKLDGVETAMKGHASSEKLAAKGSAKWGELSGEVSAATTGQSQTETVTATSGSSRTHAVTEDLASSKATAKATHDAVSGSYSEGTTAYTESVTHDAGAVLGEHTSAKAKGELTAGAESRTGKASASAAGELGGEYGEAVDLVKVSGEASASHLREGTGVTGKVTGSAGLGGKATASGKASREGVSGELSAFVGGSADTSATVTLKVADKEIAQFKGTMGITVGVGGEVSGAMSWKGGKFSWQASGKLAAGLGTSFSYNVELDTMQVAGMVADKAWSYVPDLDLFGFGSMEIDFT